MTSGIVPFSEIVQSVRDETGIENIRPFYERIRRLMFRAERQIGYGGTIKLFKKTYIIEGVENSDCNFGKFFKFPIDFIEFEGVGKGCCQIPNGSLGSCAGGAPYTVTSEGIRFKNKQDKDIVLLYWGISVDDEGFPEVTRNHEEAVIAFIVWKLYSSRMFLGLGAFNLQKDYEERFTTSLLASRGDDAFPTLEEWNELGQLSYTDRRVLLPLPVKNYDYCAEYEDIICDDEVDPEPLDKAVYHWQQDSLTDDIDDVIPLINTAFLNTKPVKPFSTFEAGYTNEYTAIGVICFVITNTEDLAYVFKDALGNNVTSIFDVHYYATDKRKLYVSKNVFSFSSVYYKIETP